MSRRVVPKWALLALESELPPDAGLLNVTTHGRNLVVANTHLGAVAVTKSPFGVPSVHLLPNPRERTGFRCTECNQALEFRELTLPTRVHCGWCGHQFELDQRGAVVKDWSLSSADEPSTPNASGPRPTATPNVAVARVRCAATIQAGGRCRLPARAGGELCRVHANPDAPTPAVLAARALAAAAKRGPYDPASAAKAIGAAVLQEAPEWANLDVLAHDPQVVQERLERMTSTFVNAAAHELRTPMTPLLLSLRTLQQEADSPDKHEAAMRMAMRSAKRLEDVVERVVRVSMVQAGKLVIEPSPMELAPVLRDACDAWQERAKSSGLRLQCHVRGSLPLAADRAAVTETINHLLSNAVRFSKPGGRIVVSAATRSVPVAHVHVTVSDEGVGIPAADLERVFEPFVQLEPALFQTESGLGLGLFFARALAQAHGGDVTLSSPGEGKGTTIEWMLPVTPAPAAPAADARRSRPTKGAA